MKNNKITKKDLEEIEKEIERLKTKFPELHLGYSNKDNKHEQKKTKK